jgi:MtN3 and saliva related transmembrane protein
MRLLWQMSSFMMGSAALYLDKELSAWRLNRPPGARHAWRISILKAYVVNHLPEIIGFLATLCTISSFLPQAIKIMRERDAESVSLKMYAITVAGFSLWTTYGILMKSVPLILANAASLSIALWILFLKLRFSGVKPAS